MTTLFEKKNSASLAKASFFIIQQVRQDHKKTVQLTVNKSENQTHGGYHHPFSPVPRSLASNFHCSFPIFAIQSLLTCRLELATCKSHEGLRGLEQI